MCARVCVCACGCVSVCMWCACVCACALWQPHGKSTATTHNCKTTSAKRNRISNANVNQHRKFTSTMCSQIFNVHSQRQRHHRSAKPIPTNKFKTNRQIDLHEPKQTQLAHQTHINKTNEHAKANADQRKQLKNTTSHSINETKTNQPNQTT